MGKCCLLPAGLHHTCIVSYPGPPVDTSLTMLLHMTAVIVLTSMCTPADTAPTPLPRSVPTAGLYHLCIACEPGRFFTCHNLLLPIAAVPSLMSVLPSADTTHACVNLFWPPPAHTTYAYRQFQPTPTSRYVSL